MRAADVLKRIEGLRELAGDPEMAHAEEDRIWSYVLIAIATGAATDDPADLAAAALKTAEIDFARWYA